MRRWSTLPRRFLATLAALLAAGAISYGSLWMYNVRSRAPRVELGYNQQHDHNYDEKTHSITVQDVVKDSPAERAGLRVGDQIIGVNGQALDTSAPFDEVYALSRPGDLVEFTISRPGETKPLTVHGVFRAAKPVRSAEGLARSSAQQITGSFPVLFLLVGFAVLFLRLEDPNAWLLALMFTAFVAAPNILNPGAFDPGLRAFMYGFRALFLGMLCPLFYLFFAVFPVQSPLDRRLPWLKWAGLALGVCMIIPGWRTGDEVFPKIVGQLIGSGNSNALRHGLTYGLIFLGMVSLAQNSYLASVPLEARRKSRVIFWGTIAGVLPIILERVAVDFAGYEPPFWIDTAMVLVLFLYPLSFAYAVVKHRAMEIPALLRRSARYVLVQRGFVVLLFFVAATAIVLFTHFFARFIHAGTNVGMALSAVFGSVLVWAAAPLVKQGTVRIDRAFFRGAYDARVILQDLAEKMRTMSDRSEMAALLEHHVHEALHPKSMACYLEDGAGHLVVHCGAVPESLSKIPMSEPLLGELARHGKSWDVPPAGSDEANAFSVLAPLSPECLVPILGREGRLIGMLVLGQRLSEEPYSGEDKHLLDSVAGQAGIALENIRLAEKMAERLEGDRRAARDLDIAREVQARLFPQVLPVLRTLDYAGACIQAREVGGDYYDFLDLGPGRLGIVLADISGKGIAAALLMANLQANLRSQYSVALEDAHKLLQSVNRLFFENTPDDRYATLFYADYHDASRRLRYANCGHNPPLLLRGGGAIEKLGATATVLGLFKEWRCEIAEVQLQPGDTLVLYTDGVTEAPDSNGDEFGEERLEETVRSLQNRPVGELLRQIQTAVQQFSGQVQADDLTLIVARVL